MMRKILYVSFIAMLVCVGTSKAGQYCIDTAANWKIAIFIGNTSKIVSISDTIDFTCPAKSTDRQDACAFPQLIKLYGYNQSNSTWYLLWKKQKFYGLNCKQSGSLINSMTQIGVLCGSGAPYTQYKIVDTIGLGQQSGAPTIDKQYIVNCSKNGGVGG